MCVCTYVHVSLCCCVSQYIRIWLCLFWLITFATFCLPLSPLHSTFPLPALNSPPSSPFLLSPPHLPSSSPLPPLPLSTPSLLSHPPLPPSSPFIPPPSHLPPSLPLKAYRVVYPFSSRSEDELDLNDGDYIYVSTVDNGRTESDGWLRGTSHNTGMTGVFPANYVERAKDSDLWVLHR